MENTQAREPQQRYIWTILALIMAVTFVLRFERPTLVEFKRDEATIARIAQAIAYEGYVPAVGVNVGTVTITAAP